MNVGTLRKAGSKALDRARGELAIRGTGGPAAQRSLVWMLGSPRTGSTWLLNLLALHKQVVPFDEPGIGYHLGLFVADVMGAHPLAFEEARLLLPAARADDRQYFFAKAYADVWKPRLRGLILARMHAQLRAAARKGNIRNPIAIIKEPTGSQVAEFLVSVLPATRLLVLVRDPRDVLDSQLDAVLHGSWLANRFGMTGELSAQERIDYLRAQAHRLVARTDTVERAYNLLPSGQRHLVKYEDLRTDTLGSVRAILDWLGLESGAKLAERVERLAFESIPESERGKGKFTRAASPGLWRESLTADEQAAIDEIVGDAAARLGYK